MRRRLVTYDLPTLINKPKSFGQAYRCTLRAKCEINHFFERLSYPHRPYEASLDYCHNQKSRADISVTDASVAGTSKTSHAQNLLYQLSQSPDAREFIAEHDYLIFIHTHLRTLFYHYQNITANLSYAIWRNTKPV